MKIENSVIIVTGGASGLGLGISEFLNERKSKVVILDVDELALSRLSENYDKIKVDLTDYYQVGKTIDLIIEKYGKIDVLVNNVGVIYNEPLINITSPLDMRHSYDAFKKTIELNLNTTFIISSFVAEKMVLKRTRGCIINISSISANGNSGQTAYSAAKAGILGLTKTWAKELGAFNIRTNAISPGFINTASTNAALSPDIISHIKSKTPLRKLGCELDIAMAVGFLIENDFINGTVIDVNGGLSI